MRYIGPLDETSMTRFMSHQLPVPFLDEWHTQNLHCTYNYVHWNSIQSNGYNIKFISWIFVARPYNQSASFVWFASLTKRLLTSNPVIVDVCRLQFCWEREFYYHLSPNHIWMLAFNIGSCVRILWEKSCFNIKRNNYM